MKRLSLIMPEELHEELKELAEQEQRSLHAQIIYILKKYIAELKAKKQQG